MSSFSFNGDGNTDDTLVHEGEARSCTCTFAGLLCGDPSARQPLAFTYWADSHVLVALPPLTCDAKIIKVALGSAGDNVISTLSRPIYFPTSTPRRKARLLYRPGTDGKDDYIYLALNGSPPKSSGGDTSPSPYGNSPPVVVRWKVESGDGWRAWDAETDSKPDDNGGNLWDMLRGSFVESGKCFSVPFRSGTDWRRKGYLSCG